MKEVIELIKREIKLIKRFLKGYQNHLTKARTEKAEKQIEVYEKAIKQLELTPENIRDQLIEYDMKVYPAAGADDEMNKLFSVKEVDKYLNDLRE